MSFLMPRRTKATRSTRLRVEPLEDRVVPAIRTATYLFQNTLRAEQWWAPALVAVDPLAQNRFESAQVYGQARQVYRLDGNPFPNENQAGLALDVRRAIPFTYYSVELVFEYPEADQAFGWRKIIDVHQRQTDTGFYVNPDNVLSVFDGEAGASQELAAGQTAFTAPGFHHLVLTVGLDVVSAYLDGTRELTTPITRVMNVDPWHLMHFFLDDFATSGEYADARIALLRMYIGTLSDAEVANLARDPFATHGGDNGDDDDDDDDRPTAMGGADLHLLLPALSSGDRTSSGLWLSDPGGVAASLGVQQGSADGQAAVETFFDIGDAWNPETPADVSSLASPAFDLAIIEWAMLKE